MSLGGHSAAHPRDLKQRTIPLHASVSFPGRMRRIMSHLLEFIGGSNELKQAEYLVPCVWVFLHQAASMSQGQRVLNILGSWGVDCEMEGLPWH